MVMSLPLCSGGTPCLAVDLADVVHRGVLPLNCLPSPGAHSPLVSSVSGTSAGICSGMSPGICSLATS